METTTGRSASKARKAGQLAQMSCAHVGMSTLLVETKGDFAVVIHGEPDCSNAVFKVFPHRLVPDLHESYIGSHRFFSTNISESEVISGRSVETILPAVREACVLVNPSLVFVVSTCLTEMIGDDIEAACRQASEETGVRVVPLRAGGLRLRSQAEVMDWFGVTMMQVSASGMMSPRSGHAAMLGYPRLRPAERQEFDGYFRTMGLELMAELPARSSLEAWAGLGSCSLVVCSDIALWPGVVSLLQQSGSRLLELPPPVGAGQTLAFLKALADASGTQLDESSQLEEAGRLRVWVAEHTGRVPGLRVAYCIGTAKNYQPGQVALEGLGDLQAFVELGATVEVLVQEREDCESHQRVGEALAQMGVKVPWRNFNDPGVLGRALLAGGFELAYCQDHVKDQVTGAGIAYLRAGTMRPGLSGMRVNALNIEAALGGGFRARYGRYLRK